MMLRPRLIAWFDKLDPEGGAMHSLIRLVTIVAAVGLVAACAQPADPAPAASTPVPMSTAGWRWESFGGVEVSVPGDWGWDNQALRLDAWCIKPGNHPPAVSRPGAPTPAIACGVDQKGPPAETLIENTG